MPRVKNLNIITTYGETGYVINDLGQNKSPRFELYHIPSKKSIKKSNNFNSQSGNIKTNK